MDDLDSKSKMVELLYLPLNILVDWIDCDHSPSPRLTSFLKDQPQALYEFWVPSSCGESAAYSYDGGIR